MAKKALLVVSLLLGLFLSACAGAAPEAPAGPAEGTVRPEIVVYSNPT